MATRITGLTSGLDTEQLVSAMVMNYKAKADKGVQAQKSLQYKLDALKKANTEVYSLFSTADKMRWSSAYTLKSTSVSDSTKAKVTASDSAVNGTQTLEIKELAQAGYLTGGTVKGKSELSTSSKLSDIYTGSGSSKNEFAGGSISVKIGGKESRIDLTSDMTAAELANKLKDAGLNASFDAKNGRFFISSKDSGAASDFTLVANDENGLKSLKALGLFTADDGTMSEYKKWADLEGIMNDPDKTAWNNYVDEQYAPKEITVKNRADSYVSKYNNAENSIKLNQESLKKFFDELDTDTEHFANSGEVAAKAETLKAGRDSDSRFAAYREEDKDEDGNVKKDDKGNTVYKYDTDKMKEAVKDGTLSEEAFKEFEALQNDIEKFDSKAKEIKKYEDAIKEAEDIKADVKDKVIVEAGEGGYTKASAVTEDNAPDKYATLVTEVDEDNLKAKEALENQLKDRITQSVSMLSNMSSGDKSEGAVRVAGQDAKILLNGAEFTSDKNSFSINGLSIETTAKTDGAITITTSTDTQGLYDKIKDFLSQYNDVVNYLSKMYNADSAKGYDPLTDDQKKEMSESEVNLWESKIKDSILRRDSTIGGITTALSTAMSKVFEINGKNYSLSSFGIKTAGYFAAEKNEKYAYHIDGDADDSTSSGNADKLMAAIVADPESVTSFFQQLSSSVYDTLNDKMRRSTLSSAYTIYNDKEMASEYSDYTKTISKWQDQVKSMEDYYFKKFSAMESTLTKLQSQTGQLSSYFG